MRHPRITLRCFTFGSLVAALLGACQPHYQGLELRLLTGRGSARAGEVEVTEGQAVAIEVRPISSNPYEDYEAFNIVELESFDQSIIFAAPADEPHRFVLVGGRAGTTAIDVIIDDVALDSLAATVVIPEVVR